MSTKFPIVVIKDTIQQIVFLVISFLWVIIEYSIITLSVVSIQLINNIFNCAIAAWNIFKYPKLFFRYYLKPILGFRMQLRYCPILSPYCWTYFVPYSTDTVASNCVNEFIIRKFPVWKCFLNLAVSLQRWLSLARVLFVREYAIHTKRNMQFTSLSSAHRNCLVCCDVFPRQRCR